MTTVYPLACSYIHFIKNQCHSFYTSHLHVYYFTAQKPRGKSLSGAGGWGALWGRGGGTLLTAMKSDFFLKTCNLQSNDAIIDPKCFGTTSVIGVKAKPRKQFGCWSKFFEISWGLLSGRQKRAWIGGATDARTGGCFQGLWEWKGCERQKHRWIIQTGSQCDSSSGQSGKR